MTKQRNLKVDKEEKVNQRLGKKSYLKPKLIEYGHLEKLTQGGTGTRSETGGGFRR
jgi:hypothetical protein